MPSTTAETLSLVDDRKVSVAPLVLLSVVDHYNRAASTSSKNKRVVGVLLGQNDGKVVRVSNSFAGTSTNTNTNHARRVELHMLTCSPPPKQFPSRRTTRTLRSGS